MSEGAFHTTFDGPCSDMPLVGNSRVHREGKEFYERNSKSSNNWYNHDGGEVAAPPEARLRSEAARGIALKNRGCMGDSMTGYANPPPERTVHPRAVKGEAAAIANGNKGRGMRSLIEDYGNHAVSPKPGPKVKGAEAEEYKEREQGSTKFLMADFSTAPIPANEQPKNPRLGLGGGQVAEKHQGAGMGPLMRLEGKKTPRDPKQGKLHQTSQGGGWDEELPHVRTRPEGEGIAHKAAQDSINDIMLQNKQPPPTRGAPKVLKHMAESESPRDTPAKRVLGDAAARNLERASNQEDMQAIMHGSPAAPPPARPASAKRIMPHLQRSELW